MNEIQVQTPRVFIVHEDASVRESLESLVRGGGWPAESFRDVKDYLARQKTDGPSCLIVDPSTLGRCCAQTQDRIAGDRSHVPVIFVMGRAESLVFVRAMKTGEVEYIAKPYGNDAVLAAVSESIDRSRSALQAREKARAAREGYETLTPREREVMGLVASGLLNKQVGGELGISEVTVKTHRGNVMRKMKARSFADLVHMAAELRAS
jgi:FixJ family two-component response regulator